MAIQNQINIEKGQDYSKALDAIEEASSYSQDILKDEWERVKRGEKSFQRAKKMPLILLIFLALIITLLFNSPEPNKTIKSDKNQLALFDPHEL